MNLDSTPAPFDIKKALAGAPVLLRNGNKGFITADYIDFFPNNIFRYQGVFLAGKSKTQFDRNSWTEEGCSFFDNQRYAYLGNPFDIVGMWPETSEQLVERFDLKRALNGEFVTIDGVEPKIIAGKSNFGDDEYIIEDQYSTYRRPLKDIQEGFRMWRE